MVYIKEIMDKFSLAYQAEHTLDVLRYILWHSKLISGLRPQHEIDRLVQ